MNQRKYIVPAASALGLSLTAACSDPLIGEWDVVQTTYDGDTFNFPMVYSDTYDGTTYTYTIQAGMTWNKDLEGQFTYEVIYQKNDDDPAVYAYNYALTALRDKKTYTINVADVGVVLDCTMSGTTLDCTESGENSFYNTWRFEKQ